MTVNKYHPVLVVLHWLIGLMIAANLGFGYFVIVRIPNTDAAQRKLDDLLSKSWAWWLVVHNCESFAEDIIVAGGGRPIHTTWYAKPVDSRQTTPGASGTW